MNSFGSDQNETRKTTQSLEETIGEREFVLPEGQEWRLEELRVAERDVYSAAIRYGKDLVWSLALRGVSVIALVPIPITHDSFEQSCYIALGGAAWLGATTLESLQGTPYKEMRDRYLDILSDFNHWRYANDREGYCRKQPEA